MKKSRRKQESNPGSPDLEADALTTRPARRSREPERRVSHPVLLQSSHTTDFKLALQRLPCLTIFFHFRVYLPNQESASCPQQMKHPPLLRRQYFNRHGDAAASWDDAVFHQSGRTFRGQLRLCQSGRSMHDWPERQPDISIGRKPQVMWR